jgi:hypothetical protein
LSTQFSAGQVEQQREEQAQPERDGDGDGAVHGQAGEAGEELGVGEGADVVLQPDPGLLSDAERPGTAHAESAEAQEDRVADRDGEEGHEEHAGGKEERVGSDPGAPAAALPDRQLKSGIGHEGASFGERPRV